MIIAAGGVGARMASNIPKQFLCLNGLPILMRSIKAFRNYDKKINVIVVLPSAQKKYWMDLCKKYTFNELHSVISGGETRFHSVKNGLAQIEEDHCLIAVHDGARPLVSTEIISEAFNCAEKNGTAVPCIKLNDSLRIVENNTSKPIDRNKIFAVQTPQCFNGVLLKKAYEQAFDERFTDDATVVENIGGKIFLTEGSNENIKITSRKDLVITEALLQNKTINPE